MAVATVSISFKGDLLREIDEIAKNEASTRTELINRATRLYVEHRKDITTKLRGFEILCEAIQAAKDEEMPPLERVNFTNRIEI
jgi:metal-responsive CopG/Arc/MetJ family transcriptional regulator